MLASKYRPSRFSDVVGQEEAVSVLRAVALRPETSPRCYILHGPFGTGKTTLARVFGRAVNCLQHKGDSCGACEVCREDSEFSPLYQENDSNQVGNVAFVREYRDTLQQTAPAEGRYRVVVFDESQDASLQSQEAMLKMLEEAPERTFFLFCTTDAEKLVSTIRSRSLDLSLRVLHVEEVVSRLLYVVRQEGVTVPDEVLRQIAIQTGGHLRDALTKLDLYLLCEDKTHFSSLIASAEDLVLRFLGAARQRDRAAAEECIRGFMRRPLAHLFRDWENVALGLLRGFSGDPHPKYKPVVDMYGADTFRVMRALASDWGSRCFHDDILFQAFAWYLFYELGKDSTPQKVVVQGSRFNKM